MRCRDRGGNPATRCEHGGEFHPFRLKYCHEIVQNPIRSVFVKNTFVAKALQIKFKTFQFDAELVGSIRKCQGAKIRLASFRANGCKLGTHNRNRIIPTCVLVFKGF